MLPESPSPSENQNKKPRMLGLIALVVICIAVIAFLTMRSSNLKPGEKKARFQRRPDRNNPVVISELDRNGEVDEKTNLTFEFISNRVEDSDVGNEVAENLVAFTPPVNGKYRWIATNRLRFYPYEPLLPATSYVADLPPQIGTLENKDFKGEQKLPFTTRSLAVIDTESRFVYERNGKVISKGEWTLIFNHKVDPAQLNNYLELNYSSSGVKNDTLNFTVSPSNISDKFTILSGVIKRTKQTDSLNLVVKKGLPTVDGPLGLREDFTSALIVEPNLKVYKIESEEIEQTRYISIELSAPVDKDLAKEYITIDPKIDFTIESTYRTLKLKAAFKSDQWYTVKIKKGLVGEDGTELEKDFAQNVKIGDLEPSLKFEFQGIYLPRTGSKMVTIESVNISKIEMSISRIYPNNIVQLMQNSYEYDYWSPVENVGRILKTEEIKIDAKKNEKVITPIDMNAYLEPGKMGIYKINIAEQDEYWQTDSKIVMVTDLGIVSSLAENDLFVWVNSLSSLNPMKDVQITLYSLNNQIIASGQTNDQGVLIVQNIGKIIEEEKFDPFLITATLGQDMSFLNFEQCRMPLASFDISGRPFLTTGYEAFLYSDRDIFRPNDNAHFAAIVRGANVALPPSFPVKLKITDPMSRNFDFVLRTLPTDGMLDFDLPIPDYAMTGSYNAYLLVGDKEIGQMQFNVEDFIPDKTKVTVKTDKSSYKAGETISLDVTGEYLFGPPAAGRDVESNLVIKASSFTPKKWQGYTFGDEERKFDQIEVNGGSAVLDENGKYQFKINIPTGIQPASSLKGSVSATVKEYGGRAVSSYTDVEIHPYPAYIGIRPKREGYAEIGKPYKLEFVTVTPEGERTKVAALKVNVYKIVYQTLLKKDSNGYYTYVSERSEDLLNSYQVSSDAGEVTFTPDDYGSYRIAISDPTTMASSSYPFYASGWGYAPWSMENPAQVEMEVDKTLYKNGDTAKVLIKAPFPGKLLLMVQREKVYDFKIVDMKENTATIDVPIKGTYKPNVYVTATVIKPLSEYDGVTPMRAFGIVPVVVDSSEKKLGIEISSPSEIRPGKKLDFNVKVANGKGITNLTVAAVDEGILQMTDYETPDPFNFFYGKKSFNAEYFDIFTLVLPELNKFKKQPSGDGSEEIRKKHLSPISIKRVEPVSLWSGIVKTDSSGNAKISFNIPEFQGRLRIMAVAANSTLAGSASKNIFIRDPIIIDSTLPRFISGEDTFTIPVKLFNNTGKDGSFEIKLAVEGPVSLLDQNTRKMQILNGKEAEVSFQAKVGNSTGKATFTVTASGSGEKTQMTTNVPVRPASPVITKTGSNIITPGKTFEMSIPGGFVSSTGKTRLILSSFPNVQFTGGLQYLLEYPHGCLEQTTSRVFPLLYFDDLAKIAEPELFKKNSAWYFVEEGISKILSMQQYDGAFTYWPGGSEINDWTSIYAIHFIVEARKVGYDIPDTSYNQMISWLRNYIKRQSNYKSNKESESWQLQRLVYACYVLALSGESSRSTVNFIHENKMAKLSPATQYQLALCYSLMGDKRTAQELIPADIQPAKVERQIGENFNSSIRENAIMLEVLNEISPDSPGIPVLVKSLTSSMEIGRWYTTQDNAFALLAMGKVFKTEKGSKYTGQVTADGKAYLKFDEKGITKEDPSLVGKKIKVNIDGKGKCYIYWQVWGVPVKPDFQEYDRGIRVNREFLDIDGHKLDYNSIPHGELIVAKITMEALNANLENVIIDDMLPAGLEIENPRLESRQEIPWISQEIFKPDYMDMRDDRLLLYVNLPKGRSYTFYYALRAVTRGTFILPPVSAECMYDPAFTSVQSSGRITVVD